MGNTYMPKPENRYPNNGSGFEHIWELDMLKQIFFKRSQYELTIM